MPQDTTLTPPKSRIVDYKSPKTGKVHSFNWNKPYDPTPDDYTKLKSYVDSIETEPTEPETIGAWGRGKQLIGGLYDTITKGKQFDRDIRESEASKGGLLKDPKMRERISSDTEGIVPTANLMEDWRNRDIGAGAFDLGMTGLGVMGLKSQVFPKAAKPLPPVADAVDGSRWTTENFPSKAGPKRQLLLPEKTGQVYPGSDIPLDPASPYYKKPAPVKPPVDLSQWPDATIEGEVVSQNRGKLLTGHVPQPVAPPKLLTGRVPDVTPISPVRPTPTIPKQLSARPVPKLLPAVGETAVTAEPRFYQGQRGTVDAGLQYPVDLAETGKLRSRGDVNHIDPRTGKLRVEPETILPNELGELGNLNPVDVAAGTHGGQIMPVGPADVAQLNPNFRQSLPASRRAPITPVQPQAPVGRLGNLPPVEPPVLEHPVGGRIVNPPPSKLAYEPNRVDVTNRRLTPEPLPPVDYPAVRTGQTEVTRPGLKATAAQVKAARIAAAKEAAAKASAAKKAPTGDKFRPEVLDPESARAVKESLRAAKEAEMGPLQDVEPVTKFEPEVTQPYRASTARLKESATPVKDTAKNIIDTWIKGRGAGKNIGWKIKQQFADVGKYTKENVAQFQQDMKNGAYPEVRKFFDDTYNRLTEKGIPLGKKKDYLPQMWENPPEEVARVFDSKHVSTKAPFQFQSFFEDYAHGQAAGLTPKYSPLEIIEQYAERANRLEHDIKFMRDMEASGHFQKKWIENAEGKRELNPSVREGWKVTAPNELPSLHGDNMYLADPKIAGQVENFLQPGKFAKTRDMIGKVKGVMLSAGIPPNTPIMTAHGGANVAMRSLFSGDFGSALKYGFGGASKTARKGYIASNIDKIIDYEKRFGLKTNLEHYEGEAIPGAKNPVSKAFNWGREVQNKYYERPLFNEYIPAVRLSSFEKNFAKFKKAGMAEQEAGEAAARLVEDTYGGYNTELMRRNKTFQNLFSVATLAPDWLESTAKLGWKIPKGMVESLSNKSSPVSKAYAKVGGKIIAYYTAADMANYGVTGKHMMENPKGHEFDMALGKDSEGQPIWINVMGGGADFFTKPMEAAAAVYKEGDFGSLPKSLASKGSPAVSAIRLAVEGSDYQGRPNVFRPRDQFGKLLPFGEMAKNTALQALRYGPPQISAPVDWLAGQASPEQAISKIGEFPLKFSRTSKGSSKLFKGLGGNVNKLGASLGK